MHPVPHAKWPMHAAKLENTNNDPIAANVNALDGETSLTSFTSWSY